MFLPTLRQRSGSLRQNIPLTGAQDTAYALAVTMNCGATARPIGQARLSQLNGGINPRWLEPHAVASIVYRLRNPRRSS